MLRTTLLHDLMPTFVKKLIRSFAFALGLILFVAIAYASLPEAIDAYKIGEYEGEGALRIYTWPIRFLIVITAVIAAIAYLTMMVADWRGDLSEDEALVQH